MKFCLFDFFEEGSVEIGSTDLIEIEDGFDHEDFTNKKWDSQREVLVNWPASKQKQGKAKGKSTQSQTPHLARIVFFADDRLDQTLLNKCKELETADRTLKTAKTRGGRLQKRPLRYVTSSSDEESDESGEVCKRQQNKAKKAKMTATREARDSDLLARLANKKEEEREAEQKEVTALRHENASLKEENASIKKERDALVTALACVNELPELLRKIREVKLEELREPAPSKSKAALSPPGKPVKTVSVPVGGGQTAPVKVLQALMAKAFSRKEMATHSLTGGKSNANAGKEARPRIDPDKMNEIFKAVQEKFPNVSERDFRDAARNKLSNERKSYHKMQPAPTE